jgi:hypothetical protein
MRDERKDRALIIKSLDAGRAKCERGEKIKKPGGDTRKKSTVAVNQ